MGWGYHFVGDSDADLKELESWLQEEVLDELELMVANVPERTPRNEIFHDFERSRHGMKIVTFVRLGRDDRSQTLIVLAVHTVMVPLPSAEGD